MDLTAITTHLIEDINNSWTLTRNHISLNTIPVAIVGGNTNKRENITKVSLSIRLYINTLSVKWKAVKLLPRGNYTIRSPIFNCIMLIL